MTTDSKLTSMLRRSAEANYSPESAASYRESDERAKESDSHAGKCTIIRDLSQRFVEPIDVLDLGCGTGRYFHCVGNVRRVIGVDPSLHMLEQARSPVGGGNGHVRLVRSTLQEVAFARYSFELVICVGVLGRWCPVDDAVLKRVSVMLRPNGVFFFTTVEYEPVPITWKRRLATTIKPALFGSPRRLVETRLLQFTISEDGARALSQRHFEDVSITRWQSPTRRVDLHCVVSRPRVPDCDS